METIQIKKKKLDSLEKMYKLVDKFPRQKIVCYFKIKRLKKEIKQATCEHNYIDAGIGQFCSECEKLKLY